MPIQLPPLSGLRLFEAAARCGSFKRAAHELSLTPGAFSHSIDALEDWLDVQLFERGAGGLVLTEAGRQYLPYVTEALSTIATGTMRLPTPRSENRIAISSTGLFLNKLLLPRLHTFREMYPNIVVTVDASGQTIELPSDQCDVTIRSSRGPLPKMSCELLGRIRFVPVGAPDYVRSLLRNGSVDWSRATLIHNPIARKDWDTWAHHSRTDIASARKLTVSMGEWAFEAAVGGLGLAIGRLPLVDDDIATGRLAVAADKIVSDVTGYWLISPPGTETRRQIIAFSSWLREEMAKVNWAGDGRSIQPGLPAEMNNPSKPIG
ncbi:MAG: LysR substrate-binding domain-containing protein [Xanthobacteraceae bacterium]